VEVTISVERSFARLDFLGRRLLLEFVYRGTPIYCRWVLPVLLGLPVKVEHVVKPTLMGLMFVRSFVEVAMIAGRLSGVHLEFTTIALSRVSGCEAVVMARRRQWLKLESIALFRAIVSPIFAMVLIITMMEVLTFCHPIARGIAIKIQTAHFYFLALANWTLISK